MSRWQLDKFPSFGTPAAISAAGEGNTASRPYDSHDLVASSIYIISCLKVTTSAETFLFRSGPSEFGNREVIDPKLDVVRTNAGYRMFLGEP